MGTTAKGYPYPEGTDLVVDGDNAIKALAEAIDAKLPYAATAGRVASGNIAADGVKTISVTLPTGLFVSPPQVTASPYTASAKIFHVAVAGATATSFSLLIWNDSGSTRTSSATWHAIKNAAPADDLLAAEPTDDGQGPAAIVTCPTAGCDNQGAAITISPSWTDEDGTTHAVDEVVCGVCGTDITASLQATS